MATGLIIYAVFVTLAWLFMAGAYHHEHKARREAEEVEKIMRRIA